MRTVDPVRYAARRRNIVEAAGGCFARKGFDRTTTADICAAAGISSGSLFHYFPNKRAVFLAIFEQDGRDNAEQLALAVADADPWAGLLELVDHLVRPLADPDSAGLVVELIAQAGRDPELAELVVGNDRELRAGIAALLSRAAEQGRIDDQVDPAQAAHWVLGLTDALFSRAGIDRDFDPLAELPTLRTILARYLGAAERIG
ncbi:TetR/AcrR family transcriptional regulator [Saccharopolyspora sp. 6M]|uniref:TetR/AcrR family transcriptional regulator n=1 Tax=Saccharopolyspora sp. 6M TaxID=2877237 RepID=UPI001CD4C12E|nr:TetR/AcrR family transcriptional regulator [Saccharopolyspora sp. 6M]MCA1224797.1 TetR/AcrR family transcriptional regulator [Saccharopolyspora sp. 6M]